MSPRHVTADGGARPRSLVFDLFAQYVREDGGDIELQSLTRLMECFDVPGDSVRVLMSRLRREGWFQTTRSGRTSVYAPTDAGSRLLEEGLQRISVRNREAWSGRWQMAIFSVPESQRAARVRVRKGLAWLGYGPLAPSTWLSPHDRHEEATRLLASEPSVSYDLMTAMSASLEEDRERAARCWDLDGLSRDYSTFLRRWERRLSSARTGAVSPRDALVQRTQIVHEYRMFLFRDPDLPDALLPPDWPGLRAHAVMLETLELLRAPATSFYEEIVAGRAGR
jgi:phenylacetic acid degradation operon negative regulatory protein